MNIFIQLLAAVLSGSLHLILLCWQWEENPCKSALSEKLQTGPRMALMRVWAHGAAEKVKMFSLVNANLMFNIFLDFTKEANAFQPQSENNLPQAWGFTFMYLTCVSFSYVCVLWFFFFLMHGLLFRVLVEQKHRYLSFMCCSFLCFYISGLPVKNNRYTTTIIKHTVKLTWTVFICED